MCPGVRANARNHLPEYDCQPAELAPAYVLLASAEGSYMTGAVIAATGGVPIN